MSEAELMKLTVAKLKELCSDKGITIPSGSRKADIVKLILESGVKEEPKPAAKKAPAKKAPAKKKPEPKKEEPKPKPKPKKEPKKPKPKKAPKVKKVKTPKPKKEGKWLDRFSQKLRPTK